MVAESLKWNVVPRWFTLPGIHLLINRDHITRIQWVEFSTYSAHIPGHSLISMVDGSQHRCDGIKFNYSTELSWNKKIE